MRFAALIIVACGVATGACRLSPNSDFPASAVAVTPPPHYRTWWAVVESCSRRRASFDAVTWFNVPIGELYLRGESAAGAWFHAGNRIAISAGWRDQGPLVRHEMLHAILRDGSHPKDYFQGKCGDEVACGWNCEPRATLPDAVEISPYALKADAVLHPAAPSLSELEGHVTVVVSVRNPSNSNVFVPGQQFWEARCAAGFMIASVSDPNRTDLDCTHLPFGDGSRVYFGAGESRRLVFEVDLRRPVYGGTPFVAEPVTVSAILLDNMRGTQEVTIRP